MRAPFRHSPDFGDPEDFDPPCPPDLTVWVEDDPCDELIDPEGNLLRRRQPFGFCSQEAPE